MWMLHYTIAMALLSGSSLPNRTMTHHMARGTWQKATGGHKVDETLAFCHIPQAIAEWLNLAFEPLRHGHSTSCGVLRWWWWILWVLNRGLYGSDLVQGVPQMLDQRDLGNLKTKLDTLCLCHFPPAVVHLDFGLVYFSHPDACSSSKNTSERICL